MIGACCNLYKTCKICGKTKWYKEFKAVGGRGKSKNSRRSYCKECKDRRKEIINKTEPLYFYDINILEGSDIEVRMKTTKKRIKYKVPINKAILMVVEGIAGIVHEKLIHRFYDFRTLRLLILERDKYTCVYCGEYGDTIDHIIPRSRGGISSLNCVCACKVCNQRKSNLSLENFKLIKRIVTDYKN